jgi:hypothetical protein
MNYYRNVMAYIHNRWIMPSDRVIIQHPEYPQGHYHDTDHKMLYIVFQILVDFVEIECGAICGPYRFENRWQKAYRILSQLPLLDWLLPGDRNALRGLHHLRWAMSLKDSPSQAQHAKDVFALYKFWKHTRPRRIDPWEWAETFTGPKRIGKGFDFSPEYSAKLQAAGDLEEVYHRDDEEQLHLLIKIRQGLWT